MSTQPQNGYPESRATVMELASVIAASRDFPDCRSPEKAAVRILAGREMGIGPIAAVLGIRIQAGRVSMDAALMAGAIKRSGRYDYRVVEHTAERCVLEFLEDAQAVGQSSFSLDDAQKAGLKNKDTWRAYPRNMLFARALSNGARWFCAAVFGGSIYSHEELGYAVDEEGRAADAAAVGELCTIQQRQQLAALVETEGGTVADLCKDLSVRMLDELSGHEAEKLIKKLQRRTAKKAEAPAPESPSTDEKPLGPAQAMLADALQEAGQPIRDDQRERILELAAQLEPDEEARVELIRSALFRRGVKRLAELNAVAAEALIETMTGAVGEGQQGPFQRR